MGGEISLPIFLQFKDTGWKTFSKYGIICYPLELLSWWVRVKEFASEKKNLSYSPTMKGRNTFSSFIEKWQAVC